jgi:hypothetical protein
MSTRRRPETTVAASPPLIPRVRRAGYGPAPPASRLLRIANATALRAGPDPGASADPRGQQARAGHGLPPGARHTQHHQIGSLHGLRGLTVRRQARNHVLGLERLGYKVTLQAIDTVTGEIMPATN